MSKQATRQAPGQEAEHLSSGEPPAQAEAAELAELAAPGGSMAPPPLHPTARGLRHAQLRQRQRSGGNQAAQRQIQRDGLPPVPDYRLTPPALLGGAPRRPALLGGDGPQLHLDPAIEAEIRAQQIRAALSPGVIRPQLTRLPLGPIRLPPPAPGAPATTPATTPGAPATTPAPAPPPGPQPRAGEPGEAPREGSAGDVLRAIAERPEVEAALGRLGDHALMEWQRLRLGGQVAFVSTTALIAGGAIAGIASSPEARRFVLGQLSGVALPVPGVDWLRVEMNAADDNLMFGLHLDVGRFLPATLGFGPGSPEAMGGPPLLEDAPGPPTMRRAPDPAAPRPRRHAEPAAQGRGAVGRQPVQRALAQRTPPATAERPTREFFNYSGVEEVRAQTMARYLRTQLLLQRGQSAIERSRATMMVASDRYNQAFQSFERVLAAGRQEARDNERWANIALGVATGALASVAIAAAIAFAAPAAAGAAIWTGTWWAVQGGAAAGSAVVGTAAADRVAATGATSEAGHDLAPPPGMRPEALQMELWRSLFNLHRSLMGYNSESTNLFLMHGASEYALAEIRAHADGGAPELSEDDLLDFVTSLVRSHQALASMDQQLDRGMRAFEQLEAAAAAPVERTVPQIESDIWVMWIASLPYSQSDVLDIDAIEDHLAAIGVLGEGSRLGVDFGLYTSEDDERSAISAAVGEDTSLRNQYAQLAGAGGS